MGSIKAPYTIEPSGAFGGGQIGYNFQKGNLVFGAEADLQISDIKDSGSGIAIGDPLDTYSLKANINWFGMVRGRLGYAFDRTLIYATGGFAYGEVERDNSYFFAFPFGGGPMTGKSSKTTTETGYVIGGGLEDALSPKWSVKGEYQYVDLGTVGVDTTIYYQGAPNGVRQHTDLDANFYSVRIGLNYHVGGDGYEPLK